MPNGYKVIQQLWRLAMTDSRHKVLMLVLLLVRRRLRRQAPVRCSLQSLR